jgi:hypothetical protein
MATIAHVSTNIKGGYIGPMHPKTLILGDNGVGKSTIIQGIVHALTASIPDGGFRESVKTEAAQRQIFTDGEIEVTSTVTDSDGCVYHHTGAPHSAWVLPDFRGVLGSTAEKLRESLTGLSLALITPAAVKAATAGMLIAPELGIKGNLGSMQDLDLLLSQVDSYITQRQQEARASNAAVNTLTAHAGAYACEADLVAARENATVQPENTVTRAEYDRAHAAMVELLAHYREAADGLEQAMVTRAALIEEAARAQSALDSTQAPPLDRISVAAAYLRQIQDKATETCACPTCGQAAPDIGARIPMLLAALEQAVVSAADYVKLKQTAENAFARLNTRQESIVRIEQRIADLRQRAALVKAVLETPVWDGTASVGDLEEITRRVSAHASIAQQREAANLAQSREGTAKALRTQVKTARDRLVGGAAAALFARLNKYLVDEEIAVDDTNKPSRVLYRRRVGDDWSDWGGAPSGAQEARVLGAFAALYAEQHPDQNVIIIPQERQWSPDGLAAAMRALESARAQVILVSTVPPSGKIKRSVWTVLDLGDAPKPTKKAKVTDAGDDEGDGDADDDPKLNTGPLTPHTWTAMAHGRYTARFATDMVDAKICESARVLYVDGHVSVMRSTAYTLATLDTKEEGERLARGGFTLAGNAVHYDLGKLEAIEAEATRVADAVVGIPDDGTVKPWESLDLHLVHAPDEPATPIPDEEEEEEEEEEEASTIEPPIFQWAESVSSPPHDTADGLQSIPVANPGLPTVSWADIVPHLVPWDHVTETPINAEEQP